MFFRLGVVIVFIKSRKPSHAFSKASTAKQNPYLLKQNNKRKTFQTCKPNKSRRKLKTHATLELELELILVRKRATQEMAGEILS